MSQEKLQLIEKLRESHQLMLDIVKSIDPALEIYPTWEIKHILAHLTGWDEATTASLKSYLQGSTPTTVAHQGVNAYNANSVTTREDLPLEHIIREYEIERKKLLSVFESISEEQMHDEIVFPWGERGNLVHLVLGMAAHESSHAREIKDRMNAAE